MKINEIFYSIQGEGSWSGLPNIFIRTTGCNLCCSFCDTKYAYKDGKEMGIKKIIETISRYPCKHVCLTGGEPLIQNETLELIDVLIKNKYDVCLETNGSINIEKICGKKSLMISLDIKCPSSNMHDKMYMDNIKKLGKNDQLKFVVKNKKDYSYAKKIIQLYKPVCPVFFQPVYGSNPRLLAEWILHDGLDVKLGLQVHKIIWGNRKRI
ncbi:MAG: radical SAM protein [Candidatus Thermoplasmatota archaeon]|jgi:7-carboxy-7-deazaguanine synthase|nr:radical SAM protein [Candidatus Thermoplasmatota archaeon]